MQRYSLRLKLATSPRKAMLLPAAGANVNAANPYKVTPLLEASGQGHLEMARYLIARGAEIDYTGMQEGSPLMLAAFMGRLDFIERSAPTSAAFF